jgi:hypothetical protein
MGLILGVVQGRSLVAAAELGIADVLAAGPLPLESLALHTHTDPGNLFRLLRALETLGIFQQISHGTFGNTAVSECLRRDAPGSQWAFVHLWAPGFGLWDGYTEMLDTLRTGKTALFERWGYGMWEHFRRHPDRAEILNEAMRSMTAPMTPTVTAAYNWSRFHVIADIGGGIGTQLVDILAAHPRCRGVLFDQPEVVAAGIPHDRIERVAGSFFEHIPVEADAYLLRNIIHDWSDADSLSILRTLRKATKPSARVMLIEWLIPDTSEFSFGKWSDITMMSALGGQERTEADFERLFRDSGFELEEIVPTASTFTITVGGPIA